MASIFTQAEADFSADEIERLAAEASRNRQRAIRTVWVAARCEHGHTREEECVDCEGGYATDHHTFFLAKGSVAISGISDDGSDVCYIPGRYSAPLERYLKTGR